VASILYSIIITIFR